VNVNFSNVLIFAGLISVGVGLILAFTLQTIDRSAKFWIAGSLVSGAATLLRNIAPSSEHFLAVSIPNALNLLINVLFALSIRALIDRPLRFDQIMKAAIPLTAAYAGVHEALFLADSALIEIVINPIVQISLALTIGYFSLALYRERQLRFAAIMAVLQVMLAILWVIRLFTGLAQGRINFEALSVVNTLIFTPLILIGTLRLLCYLGLRLEEYALKVDRGSAEGLLNTLNTLALSRDNETGNHVLRTRQFIGVLAKHLEQRGRLDTQGIRNYPQLLQDVAPLHDIGKVGIPDRILKKPGKLDPEEWEIMQTHPTIGATVLDAARPRGGQRTPLLNEMLTVAKQIALSHHENWDGSGYPQGLRGKAIPQAAQLMMIADAYDALRSRRIYKDAWSHEQAVEDIVGKAGTRFDPELVAAFVAEAGEFRRIADTYRD